MGRYFEASGSFGIAPVPLDPGRGDVVPGQPGLRIPATMSRQGKGHREHAWVCLPICKVRVPASARPAFQTLVTSAWHSDDSVPCVAKAL